MRRLLHCAFALVLLGLMPAFTQNAFAQDASRNARPSDGGENVAWVQQSLTALGYDCGTVNGVMNDRTRSCIRIFQKANGLDPTGAVNERTYEGMLALVQAKRGRTAPQARQFPRSDPRSERNEDMTEPPPPPPSEPEEAEQAEEVYIVVEDPPELIGGRAALQEAAEYPEFAKKAGIEGRVFVQFIVDEQGDVQDPQVTRGVHKLLDQAAVEAVKEMKFRPARQRGQTVKFQMSLPVTFRLP